MTRIKKWLVQRDFGVTTLTIQDRDKKIHIIDFPDEDRELADQIIWAIDSWVARASKKGPGRIVLRKELSLTIGFCHCCNKSILSAKDCIVLTVGRKSRRRIGVCKKCLRLLRQVVKRKD